MQKPILNRLIPLLIDHQPANDVVCLLRDIIVLVSKLDHLTQQDFYFQKGKIAHQKRLAEMKNTYAGMVEVANNHNLDFFLEQIKESESRHAMICGRNSNYPVFVKLTMDAKLKSDINYSKSIIQAKGQFGKLKSLEELMNDESSLLLIFKLL